MTGPQHAPPQHHLLLQLSEWRRGLADVAAYSAAPVPLVYTQVAATRVTCHVYPVMCTLSCVTQVVHLAVTVYLLVSLVSDQCLESEEPDIILPIFTVFKFLFIFGQCFPIKVSPSWTG